MATLSTIRTYVRSSLNEDQSMGLSNAEIDRIVNDGCLDVSAKLLCIQETQVIPLSIGSKVVEFTGHKVEYVDLLIYDTGVLTETRTLRNVFAQNVGFTSVDDDHPAYWFQFGNCIVLDPTPTLILTTTGSYSYELSAIVAVYPENADSGDLLTQAGDPIQTQAGETLTQQHLVEYLHYILDNTNSEFSRVFEESVIDFALAYVCLKQSRWDAFKIGYHRYVTNGTIKKDEYVDAPADVKDYRKIPKDVIGKE